MARLPRLVIPQQPHHVIQRGIDGQVLFRDSDDHANFLRWMREASRQFKVAIHAYVLMPDHLQMLLTPADESGLGRMMQWIGRHYVPYFNTKYGRAGTLWQGRYKATVIDAAQYFMTCSRYIELAPVYNSMVSAAEDYLWSSYIHHVGVKTDPAITDHALYWALGNTPFDREAAYRSLAEQALADSEISALSKAVSKGWALGSDKFKAALEKQTGRRVSPARRGRPAKGRFPKVDRSDSFNT